MEKKLGDAELKVMQVLWRTGGCPARQVAEEDVYKRQGGQ